MYRDGGSRLQYDTYYHRGKGWTDNQYYKKCPKQYAIYLSGKCSNKKNMEREWKEALFCGWFNGYNGNKIAKKALDNIESYTKNLKQISCIAALIYNRTGNDNCLNLVLTWWVIYLSGHTKNMSRNDQRDMAAAAIKRHVPSFNGPLHCSQYY